MADSASHSDPPADLPPAHFPADSDTAQSARSAVLRYNRELNAAYYALDATRLRLLTGEHCATCDRYISSVLFYRSNGSRILEATRTVDIVGATERKGRGHFSITFRYSLAGFRIVDEFGRVQQLEPPQRYCFATYDLRLRDGLWQVDSAYLAF